MVPFFKRYRINDFDTNRFAEGLPSMSVVGVDAEDTYSFDKFDPDNSVLDRKLLKEMLGRERDGEIDTDVGFNPEFKSREGPD